MLQSQLNNQGLSKQPFRRFSYLTFLAGAIFSCTTASAQDFPEQDITYIVQSGVGGGSDILARTFANVVDELDLLPVNILVENRAGGAGAIAYSFLAQQKGNAHYLGGVGVSFFTTPLLGNSAVDYRDFTPVAAVAYSPYILSVRTESDIMSVEDIRGRPDTTAGTGAVVSDPTLLSRMLERELDTQIRVVPFDGEGEVLSAVLGGHLDLVFGNPSEIIEQIQAGNLRPLAVTASERLASLPDVPTFTELGHDIEHIQLRGLVLPPDVSSEHIAFWEDILRTVAESDLWRSEYVDRFNDEPIFLDSQAFGEQMVETNETYETLMRELDLID
ncbi:Bug family tripartite tricarboxylate transporter substrate binding protein [Pelagibacterium lacus]|uniref:Tripartite tricarboxylate transporter substrate binding protein n=1 Tax=Pelagibacterium lacus TaxID=2282655 RepID=A0A369VZQ6_9HYPH|nr:tripartite tricarboxylate transporter substrate binding protein [Pelagibacterium lacus]RDE07623.1 tripartite tricarboxylate transporter substrate binding protein [Pelagibacterium lacus]